MNSFKKVQFQTVQKLLEINEKIVFERRLNKALKSVLKKDVNVVFDVGANKGQSIRLFQKWFPESKIYSFEPNPKLFSKLENKHKKNKKTTLFKFALSNENGIKTFNENAFDSSSTLETVNANSTYLQKKSRLLGIPTRALIVNTYPVTVRKLSDVIKELNITSIDFIKIDVEGHELQCLKGLFDGLNAEVKCIQIEAQSHDLYLNNDTLTEIYDLMKRNGFDQSKKIKHGFGDFSDVIFWRTKNQ